jgi:hypothetical protein
MLADGLKINPGDYLMAEIAEFQLTPFAGYGVLLQNLMNECAVGAAGKKQRAFVFDNQLRRPVRRAQPQRDFGVIAGIAAVAAEQKSLAWLLQTDPLDSKFGFTAPA